MKNVNLTMNLFVL